MNKVDKNKNTTFGFFDSGMGGFFMMQSCIKVHSEYDYIYVGDTKNLPYGPKSSQEILSYMKPHLLWLIEDRECDYVLVACNTASAEALETFKNIYPEYRNRIISIVELTQKYLTQKVPKLMKILVLATQRTVKSSVYKNIAHHEVTQLAMPGLVDLIEENDHDGALAMMSDALSYYPNINYLLLGCTHYVDLESILVKSYHEVKILGQDIILIDYIENNIDMKKSNRQGKVYCYVTGNPEAYIERFNVNFEKLKNH